MPSFLRAFVPFLLLLLSACGAPKYDDPVRVMTDRSVQIAWRMDAARQAEQAAPTDPKRLAALDRLAWEDGQPDELRIYAIDQLLAIDEKDFIQKLDQRIVLIPYGPPMDHIYAIGKDRRWPQLTPLVVKRWAVPVFGKPDNDRQERKWLEELNPGRDVKQVVFDVFVGPDEKVNAAQRIGAWALLNRIAGREELIAYLGRAPDSSALVVDLKAAGAELHTLPRHREGVKWLYFLRDPQRATVWQSAKANVLKLSAAQRMGLALRHLAILPLLDADTLAKDRDALLKQVTADLFNEEHHLTGPDYDAPMKDYPQRITDWQDKLSWADLAAIRVLSRAVRDPALKQSLFDQADRDEKNKSTEYGGVLDIAGGKPVAKEYAPMLRVSHDRRYPPTEEMIQHCYTGLAHYHFHAQSRNNSTYAGPGRGDLETAERMDFNFLVFTFINENRLNVDYYQPGGVVVDLGTIKR